MIFGQFIEYRGHVGSIEYSPEDGVYYGSLLGIKDFVNYEGNTIEELYKYYQEAVDCYVDLKNELESHYELHR